jgi:hypothetical protein
LSRIPGKEAWSDQIESLPFSERGPLFSSLIVDFLLRMHDCVAKNEEKE